MSVYADMGDAPEPKDMDYIVMEGDFYCTAPGCRESSEKALYFLSNSRLVWVCPNGHESASKDVNL